MEQYRMDIIMVFKKSDKNLTAILGMFWAYFSKILTICDFTKLWSQLEFKKLLLSSQL
mgnify:CR=1 FL=1|jgi:hypothetical protein